MNKFTSIQVGGEKVKVPYVTSQMLTDIAEKWQCSKATAAEIIVAQIHGQEFLTIKRKARRNKPV